MDGRTLTFDSFECAIAALAPVCPHCGCRIIGHGVQHGDTIYCCVHCAKHEGVKGLVDRDQRCINDAQASPRPCQCLAGHSGQGLWQASNPEHQRSNSDEARHRHDR